MLRQYLKLEKLPAVVSDNFVAVQFPSSDIADLFLQMLEPDSVIEYKQQQLLAKITKNAIPVVEKYIDIRLNHKCLFNHPRQFSANSTLCPSNTIKEFASLIATEFMQ